ncbi:hypothetical protein HNQ53_003560 [Microbulbifer hydrolyticus]|uniref:Uncharacterized protein n=1 Tax=Microbulbifer hydrolyticus TaxID=48074 RepID=A0AA89TIF6_9GAMM|nr:hypothetical protein [Microbulbifer hydrolyticus]
MLNKALQRDGLLCALYAQSLHSIFAHKPHKVSRP